ncbi:hypothetical protein TNIN_425401 [Trichonephila inaurata madagascariensis]|uniref:Uncharacterized protein n=1 Tax=Trichonephila inaurata madagascariensis TaxID=2747483 RepID=A0A8X7C3S3_9ARAC|nr:hypothetical protein TNIN_425401 [Trichonephila inaurata madagascariensis]
METLSSTRKFLKREIVWKNGERGLGESQASPGTYSGGIQNRKSTFVDSVTLMCGWLREGERISFFHESEERVRISPALVLFFGVASYISVGIVLFLTPLLKISDSEVICICQ